MSWLGQHPELFVSSIKEPNWFNDDVTVFRQVRSGQAYQELFAGAGDRLTGEGTTGYLFSQRAAANLAAANPACKVMAAFRDPAEVAPALHAQLVWEGIEPEREFSEAWKQDRPGRLPDGITYEGALSFGSQWQRVLDAFPAALCHTVWMDDLRQDPGGVVADIASFLGVDPTWRPTTFKVVNERKDIQNFPLHRLLCKVPRTWKTTRRGGLVYQWKHRNSRPAAKSHLPSDLAAQLRSTLDAEVALLARLTGRDLTHWRAD